MSVMLYPKAMVRGPKQNLEKTASGKVEGQQHRATIKSLTLHSSKKGASKNHQQVLINRLITRMTSGSRYPPALDFLKVERCTRRWVSDETVSLASAVAFGLAQGHNQFRVVTSAATQVCYVDCWRLRKIKIWTINSIENPTTCTIYPASFDIDSNSYNDREAAYSCSSRSEAEPGHMEIIPARDTPLGSWHLTSSVNSGGVLFNLIVDYGGASSGDWSTVTMDLEFDYVLNLVGQPKGYSTATATALPSGTMCGSNLFSNGMILQGINIV